MSPFQLAFYIGLFGSIHCIGMCGPLAFAIPVSGKGTWRIIADKTLYNFGRILSYTTLGLIIGLIGRQLWLAGLQQGIALASGMLIILAGFARMFKIRLFSGSSSRFLKPVSNLISFAVTHHAGNFIVGVLNGLLPCGFVYLALVGAINTSSATSSAEYMFWFGMGTFPLMLLATIGSGFVSLKLRRNINKAIPYFMVCLGMWFVFRGLNLNIPYLSPEKSPTFITNCH